MRLIDADALMETIRGNEYPLTSHLNSRDNGMFTIGIQQAVDEQPTIEAEPVRHGRWIYINGREYLGPRCSSCQKGYDYKYNYCPNCGSRMDGESE